MKKVSLKLSSRSVSNKIGFGGSVILQTTGNDYIPTTLDGLAELPAAVSALSLSSERAATGGKADTDDMYAKEHAFDLIMTRVGNAVQSIANDSPDLAEAIISSTGIDVMRTGANKAIPTLSVKKGEAPNTVLVRRKSLGLVVYKWEYSLDPFGAATWVSAGESTVASITIEGLDSLKRYWFRVATIKGHTQSEFSDPVTFVVA